MSFAVHPPAGAVFAADRAGIQVILHSGFGRRSGLLFRSMEITENGLFRSGLYFQRFYAGKKAYTKHTGNKKTAHKTQTQFLQTVSQME
jgi:hypothetical protein